MYADEMQTQMDYEAQMAEQEMITTGLAESKS